MVFIQEFFSLLPIDVFRFFYIFSLFSLLGMMLFVVVGGFLFEPQKAETDSASILAESVPTPISMEPVEVGDRITPQKTYTLDASDSIKWVFFDFSRGSVIEQAEGDSLDWDIAFRRAKILTNSGATNKNGKGGAMVLERKKIDEVNSVPVDATFETDYKAYNKADKENGALATWYKYNFISHHLDPKPQVFIIRTADGRFAKLKILSFYCQGNKAGCYTFQYVYQGIRGTLAFSF